MQSLPGPLDDDMTEACPTGETGQLVSTGLVLVEQNSGHKFPIVLVTTRLPDSEDGVLHFENGQLRLEPGQLTEYRVAGTSVSQPTVLTPGQTLAYKKLDFLLEQVEMLAILEGLTPPHKGDCWPLGNEEAQIGRPGKRSNLVELLDRTVSRAHATIRYAQDRFVVEPDTGASKTTVNGRPVDSKTVLRNGDLVGFGQQILRFQSTNDTFGSRFGTIFFCDVWDYSKMFHDRSVQEVAAQMKEFYECAGEAVEEQRGLVLRYIGDALLASFSENGHADAAVEAGRNLLQRLEKLNADWEARGVPPMRVGVGLNSGEFALGHMGFAGYIEFGALGPDVNMAARIEKLTREHDCSLLVGDSTFQLLERQEGLVSIGSVSLKGAQSAMTVYRIS